MTAPPAPLFVLLHSSSFGPSTWAMVANELRASGADVEVPSMLGFADEGLRMPGLGWPVKRLDGEHLRMLIDPAAVADALHDLAGTLIPAIAGPEA